MRDLLQYIGQTYQVTEEDTGRVITIRIGDGGPLKWWDHRPTITLKCSFDPADGRKSNFATADSAAGVLARELMTPWSVGMVNKGNGFEMQVEREYVRGGPKFGRTSYTITVFCGPPDRHARIEEITEGLPLAARLKAIEEFYDEIRRGQEGPLPPPAAPSGRVVRVDQRRPDARADAAMARMEARIMARR